MQATTRTLATIGLAASLLLPAVGGGSRAYAGPITSPADASVTITFHTPIFSSGFEMVSIGFPGQDPGDGMQTARVAAGRFTGTASQLVNVDASIFVNGIHEVFMYCFDLYQAVGAGDGVEYSIRFGEVMDRTLAFIGAVNRVLNQRRNTLDSGFDPYAWVRPETKVESAAIQLGLWESKYESDGWDLGSGDFTASGFSGPTKHELTSYFAMVGSAEAAPVAQNLTMLFVSDRFQDMITADPPGTVPAPGTLLLLALGLVPFRRRLRIFAKWPAREDSNL